MPVNESLNNTAPAAPVNLLGLNCAGLAEFFVQMGEKPFRAQQVLQWLHQRKVADFRQMSDLAKPLRERLLQTACVELPKVVLDKRAADGTRKWLLQLADGNCIETVFIPETGRGTLCISSQVGCALDCSFCATARQGFNRNLSVAEIVGQLWLASDALRNAEPAQAITNVVFMGMGEPLLNLNSVVPAAQIMLDDFAYGLSKRRVTVSTSGVVPALDKLREQCDVALAISLHATDDALRDELVPINRHYPIAELLAACRRYIDTRNRHMSITFEYVMLAGINDSDAQARALARLLRDLPAKINLIPFNPFPGSNYLCSPLPVIERFQGILHNLGMRTTMRRTRGQDIDAACGQLAGRVLTRRLRSAKPAPGARAE